MINILKFTYFMFHFPTFKCFILHFLTFPDLEKRTWKPKSCMFIEDIYMHYVYDSCDHPPFCIWELGQNESKNLYFGLYVAFIGSFVEGQGHKE